MSGLQRKTPLRAKNPPLLQVESGAYTSGRRRCERPGPGTEGVTSMQGKPTDPLARYVVEDRGYRTPCWIWQGAPDGSNGYGRLRVGGGRRMPAHRFFYAHHVGSIPEGAQLDHLCCVPLCVNPEHLEPVTGLVNNRRRRWNRLSEEQAREIRAFRDEFFRASPLNAKGQPRTRFPQGVLQDLARRYGVSTFTVIHVLKDRTWA